MPKCKNCGTRLTKFDDDICPVCGTKNPLKGVTSDTIEVTSEISLDADVSFRVCHKKTMFMFFAFIGYFGSAFFYLKKIKFGLLWFLINCLIGAVTFFATFLLFKFAIEWAIVCAVVLIYILNIFTGLIYLLNSDLKDGDGEYVR